MKKKKIFVCVGTRPNFIKITLLEKCFADYPEIEYHLIHTGQHFDFNMSDVFFKELGIQEPKIFLGISGGTQIELIARIMVEFEKLLLEHKPDLVMVPGDVNSSVACAIAASRNNIPLAHIESGLRSFDRTMPEELNRIIIDDLSDLFFVTEQSGMDNLIKEGKPESAIHFIGNTMIDSMVHFSALVDQSPVLENLNVEVNNYILITFHRPVNVDDMDRLKQLVYILNECSKRIKIVFPIHPRTRKNLETQALMETIDPSRIILTDPLGYVDFMKLTKNAKCIITDSGGIQEETTFLGIPCITIRPNTERPVTVDIGSNTLAELDEKTILHLVQNIMDGNYKKGQVPPLWDGRASERMVAVIDSFLGFVPQ